MSRKTSSWLRRPYWGVCIVSAILCAMVASVVLVYCRDHGTLPLIATILTVVLLVITLFLLVRNLRIARIQKEMQAELYNALKRKGSHNCPKCGNRVGMHDVFCNHCGTKLR